LVVCFSAFISIIPIATACLRDIYVRIFVLDLFFIC